MMWVMALALATAAPAMAQSLPPAQAEPSMAAVDLGVRLARAGTLSSIGPMLAEKDIADVIKDHPEWSESDVSIFRTASRRVATADIDRLVRALGLAYARRLSIEDLTALVRAVEGPRAARRRAIEAPALVEALQSVGAIDFKHDIVAAFCAQMGKGCPAK